MDACAKAACSTITLLASITIQQFFTIVMQPCEQLTRCMLIGTEKHISCKYYHLNLQKQLTQSNALVLANQSTVGQRYKRHFSVRMYVANRKASLISRQATFFLYQKMCIWWLRVLVEHFVVVVRCRNELLCLLSVLYYIKLSLEFYCITYSKILFIC